MTNRTPIGPKCPSCGANASGKFCSNCGASLDASACANCGSALAPGAHFCSECGEATSASARSGRASNAPAAAGGVPAYIPWAFAGLLLVSVLGYFAGKGFASPPAAPAGDIVAPFAAAGAAPGAAPDITNMTPRERASRLYDRIMRYTEEGKKDSAQFFAPMAMQSYAMLGPDLDLDARYDWGRVAAETGSLDVASAQADTILKQAPTHLLGLALRARTATAMNDKSKAATTWKAFLAAKDAELKKALPEYQMHAADIAAATKLAGSQ